MSAPSIDAAACRNCGEPTTSKEIPAPIGTSTCAGCHTPVKSKQRRTAINATCVPGGGVSIVCEDCAHHCRDCRPLDYSQWSGSKASVGKYIRHVELFGSEGVLRAANDLTLSDRGTLKAFIETKEAGYRFKDGRWQEQRGPRPRACEHCGLDLPLKASSLMRYHRHCRRTAKIRRWRGRQSTVVAPLSPE